MGSVKNLFKDNSEKDNAIVAVEQFIKQLKIPITSKEIFRKLPWQPDYPSLQSVKTFLGQINVESIIIEADKEKLFDMPQTMLCHFNNSDGGEFRTVIKHNPTHITVLTMNNVEETFSLQKFLSSWSGIVLLAEKNEYSGSKKFKSENRLSFFEDAYFYLIPTFIFLSTALLLFFNSNNASAYSIAKIVSIYILEWLGLMLSILILKNSVDGENNLLDKLCFKTEKNKDCNNLFTSKGAFLLGVSLSEFGFVWFASIAIYTLFVPQGIYFLCLLFCLALVILPYSLFYQWRIAKQWCAICLLVMAIIFAQSIIGFSFIYTKESLNISISDILYFAVSMGIVSLFWFTVKQSAYMQKPFEMAETNYHNLKYKRKIFDLIQQDNTPLLFDNQCGIIQYNNPEVVNNLILVVSLSCNPCSNAFKSLNKITRNETKINNKIIISCPNDAKNVYHKATSILFGIYKNQGIHEFENALDFWYFSAQKDFNKFSKKYSESNIDSRYENEISEMFQWNIKNNILFTPTWYINEKELDEKYNIEDIQTIFYT